MGAFQKFVEWGTDSKYVPIGKKCDICGEKLGALATGFWSMNAKQVTDGVLCNRCYEKLEMLREYRSAWVPKSLHKEPPFYFLTATRMPQMNLQQAKEVLEAVEKMGKEELSAFGPEHTSLFRTGEACFIEADALQVGVARAKQLNRKLVVFGFVQLGQFKKDDRVLILSGKQKIETAVLEAYAYDCAENTLDVNLKAHMGKQQLERWQSGWLVLDHEEKVSANATLIK